MKKIIMRVCAVLLATSAMGFGFNLNAAPNNPATAEMPSQIEVNGAKLVLNGSGVRTRLFFKVYRAGLYLPLANKDAAAILNNLSSAQMRLVLLREVGADTFSESLEKGLKDNLSASEFTRLTPSITQLFTAVRGAKAVKEGDVIALNFADSGVHINLNQKPLADINIAGFGRALLSIWLGEQAVDKELKQALLGS